MCPPCQQEDGVSAEEGRPLSEGTSHENDCQQEAEEIRVYSIQSFQNISDHLCVILKKIDLSDSIFIFCFLNYSLNSLKNTPTPGWVES